MQQGDCTNTGSTVDHSVSYQMQARHFLIAQYGSDAVVPASESRATATNDTLTSIEWSRRVVGQRTWMLASVGVPLHLLSLLPSARVTLAPVALIAVRGHRLSVCAGGQLLVPTLLIGGSSVILLDESLTAASTRCSKYILKLSIKDSVFFVASTWDRAFAIASAAQC